MRIADLSLFSHLLTSISPAAYRPVVFQAPIFASTDLCFYSLETHSRIDILTYFLSTRRLSFAILIANSY